MSNPLKNTQKIQGGLAHQKCYTRVQPGHSVIGEHYISTLVGTGQINPLGCAHAEIIETHDTSAVDIQTTSILQVKSS